MSVTVKVTLKASGVTGECDCKDNVEGRRCEVSVTVKVTLRTAGVTECDCKGDVEGRRCDR